MRDFWHPNFRIGVLGGGQLGRMLIPFSVQAGINLSFLDPDPTAPCSHVWPDFTIGDIQKKEPVVGFGKKCDLITIEIERVNTDALEQLESQGVAIRPHYDIIKMIQDKYLQKKFYKDNGFPTADFVKIDHVDEMKDHADFFPAVMKTRKDGYDGRGVVVLDSLDDISQAFDAPSILEKKIEFQKEISVIVARSLTGEVKVFPTVEMEFHPQVNLVEYVFSPANILPSIEKKATQMAMSLATQLGLEGILAVEMFVTHDDQLLINEMAPRPHNSGHHTIEACATSQYEQHLRAILGLPLGPTDMTMPAVMINILGAENEVGLANYNNLKPIYSLPNTHCHIYGKKETRPFRKMGHITFLNKDIDKAKQVAREWKKKISITATQNEPNN